MELAVQIVRFVNKEPQPGIVACEFTDAEKRVHTLIDKVPIFSTEDLDEWSTYPSARCVRCEVISQWRDTRGRDLVRITTGLDGVESTEGLSEFIVLAGQVG